MDSQNPAMLLLAKSALAQRQIQQLLDQNWKFDFRPGQSNTDFRKKTIHINSDYLNNGQFGASQMAHELGHAFHPVIPDWSSREAFINSNLYGEGEAKANNIAIAREISIPISGTKISEYTKDYDDGIKAGDMSIAYREIAQAYGHGERTENGQFYRDYYGLYYNLNHP